MSRAAPRSTLCCRPLGSGLGEPCLGAGYVGLSPLCASVSCPSGGPHSGSGPWPSSGCLSNTLIGLVAFSSGYALAFLHSGVRHCGLGTLANTGQIGALSRLTREVGNCELTEELRTRALLGGAARPGLATFPAGTLTPCKGREAHQVSRCRTLVVPPPRCSGRRCPVVWAATCYGGSLVALASHLTRGVCIGNSGARSVASRSAIRT